MPNFVSKIFAFPPKTGDLEGKDEKHTKRIQSGLTLITELKKIFGLMAVGNKKYVEPGPVLKAIIDDNGN
jgi:hypothetical protein